MITDAVPHAAIDALNALMVPATLALVARGTDGPFNYNLGNLQQSPPYDAEVFDASIFVNPFATQITNAWLGERPVTFVSTNLARGGGRVARWRGESFGAAVWEAFDLSQDL